MPLRLSVCRVADCHKKKNHSLSSYLFFSHALALVSESQSERRERQIDREVCEREHIERDLNLWFFRYHSISLSRSLSLSLTLLFSLPHTDTHTLSRSSSRSLSLSLSLSLSVSLYLSIYLSRFRSRSSSSSHSRTLSEAPLGICYLTAAAASMRLPV